MKKVGILILSFIFLVGIVSAFGAIQTKKSHTVYREDLLRLCYENYESLEYNGMQLPDWYGGRDTDVNQFAIKLVKGWRIDPRLIDDDGYIRINDLEYDEEKNRLYDNATGKRYSANRSGWAGVFTKGKYRISVMYTEVSYHDLIQMFYTMRGLLEDNDIPTGSVTLNFEGYIAVEIQNKEDLPYCAEVLKEACEKISKSAFDYIELSVGTNMPY